MKNIVWIPLTPDKEGWVFSSNSQDDAERGCIGHLRGDFGSSGEEFWTSWFDHQTALKSQAFKDELQDVVNALRKKGALLSSFSNMRKQCSAGYACDDSCFCFMAVTDAFTYCLRCIPRKESYNFYLYAYVNGERIDICTINMNEGEGRQTIYLDPKDHRLHTDYDDSECCGVECHSLSEAQDVAWALWGKSGYWFLEWIEHD